MPNPSEPERDDTPNQPGPARDAETSETAGADAPAAEQQTPHLDEQATDTYPVVAADDADTTTATEVFTTTAPGAPATEAEPQPGIPGQTPPERRFTAPGFDAGRTQVIQAVPEPPTEAFPTQPAERATSGKAPPQLIPPHLARKLPASVSRSWGWVLAFALIILTLAAIAVLGTIWLTHSGAPKVSQEDRVRTAIQNFDIAVQNGDLATLRSITCGSFRDSYVNYNEQAWDDTHRRVAAAKQYPVVTSIDEVVVNGDHAEANVTAFMAYAPEVRSTRSFDLQYRDDQWKICQSQAG